MHCMYEPVASGPGRPGECKHCRNVDFELEEVRLPLPVIHKTRVMLTNRIFDHMFALAAS